MKLKKLAVGVGMALAIGSVSSHAALLAFEDDNIDFLLDENGVAKTSGILAVNDTLVSIFEIGVYTIDGVNAIPVGQELTGVAAVRLLSGDGSLANPWKFGRTTQGLNTWSDTNVVGGGANGGAALAMWLNPTADFDLDLNFSSNAAANCTSLADCITKATVGELVQVDGFTTDLDEFWDSTLTVANGNDVGIVAGTSGALTVANFNAALTTLFNKDGTVVFREIATGNPCPAGSVALDGCVAGAVLSGPAKGGNGLNAGILADGAFARSDFDIDKRTGVVPEPGVLALLGISFLGMAMTRRRSR